MRSRQSAKPRASSTKGSTVKSKKGPSKKDTVTKAAKQVASKSVIEKAPSKGKGDTGAYDDLESAIIDPGWKKLLEDIIQSDDFKKIKDFLNAEHVAGKEIFPPKELIFNCFNLTPVDKVKVVIIGQDPYHDGSAHGLAFSIPHDQPKLPSSLRTIYKELMEDPEISFSTPAHGNLQRWAERGVLLLNVVLTVEAHKANSHSRCGWSSFTDQLIQALTENHDNIIFILWGNFAKKKRNVCLGNQIFLEGAHPSGMTCGKFYGCRHFSEVNKCLEEMGKDPIDWNLE